MSLDLWADHVWLQREIKLKRGTQNIQDLLINMLSSEMKSLLEISQYPSLRRNESATSLTYLFSPKLDHSLFCDSELKGLHLSVTKVVQ